MSKDIVHCLIYGIANYSDLVKKVCDTVGNFSELFGEFGLLLKSRI